MQNVIGKTKPMKHEPRKLLGGCVFFFTLVGRKNNNKAKVEHKKEKEKQKYYDYFPLNEFSSFNNKSYLYMGDEKPNVPTTRHSVGIRFSRHI